MFFLCSRAMTAFGDNTGLPLDERQLRAVAAWCARHEMSARRFGVGALGIPGYVGLQAWGRPLRVDTADRVLAFMGHPPPGALLRAEVEAFLAVSGTKLSILGEEAVGNPSLSVFPKIHCSQREYRPHPSNIGGEEKARDTLYFRYCRLA